jgi:hypothetical protein
MSLEDEDKAVNSFIFDIKTQIENKIHLWDSMYGGQDKTLYTLGLRHALDMITGETATDKNGFNDKPYVAGQEFKLEDIEEEI